MDTHNAESVTENTAPESGAAEQSSFADALDAAFSQLDIQSRTPNPEPQSTGPDSGPQAGGEQDSGSGEPTTPQAAETASEEPVEQDPIEQLGSEFDWTPKAANRFKQLKEELKGSRSELEQLRQLSKEQETRLQELSAIAENKDIEQLQQRIAEFEHQQMFSNLEQTTAYKQSVTEPLGELMGQVDQIADKYEVDGNSLIDIIALDDSDMQDEKLSELLPNASDRDKARIYRIIEEIGPILERRKSLYDNVEAAVNEAALLEETRQKHELAERATQRRNITRSVVDRIAEKLPFVKTFDGVDMKAVQDKASAIDPTVIHPVDFAYNAVSAQLLPTLAREYVALRDELDVLTSKLAEFEGAEPNLSGSGGSARGARPAGGDGNFIEAIDRAFGGL